jgi:pimeloyl-ACP methyl ester carboxylesterase
VIGPGLAGPSAAPAPELEPTRARYPRRAGAVDRDGVAVHWELYGDGEPAIMFVPPWAIVDSRCWKLQVPDFSRRHRVVVFDPRGNGRSGRPLDPAAYLEDEYAADALAVLDATETERALLVALSLGAQRALLLAAEHPDRVTGLALVGAALDLGQDASVERQAAGHFLEDVGRDDGWLRYNAHSWRRDFQGFLQFFFEQVFCEPHSTKEIEDCVRWGLQTDAETLIAAELPGLDEQRTRQLCARVQCPVLVVHGDQDRIAPHAVGVELARITAGRLVTFAGSGHCPQAREPVRFNLALRQFVASLRLGR